MILTAVVVAIVLLQQRHSAQAAAEEYFAALAAGDATAANALTDMSDQEADETVFLTDEVLASATERISEVEITPAEGSDGIMEVSYRLAGRQYSSKVELDSDGAFLPTWRLSSPFTSQVALRPTGPGSVTVVGASDRINADREMSYLFPAVYDLVPREERWAELREKELVVADDVLGFPVTLTGTDELTAEVQRQADELLDECVAAAETSQAYLEDLKGCPSLIAEPPSAEMPGTWEVVDYPVVSAGIGFRSESGRAVFTPAHGTEPVYADIRGLSGSISVTADAVTIVK